MRKSFAFLAAVIMLCSSGWMLHGQDRVNDCVVVLPQVARGDLIETTVVFLNTSTTAVDVEVVATDDRLLEHTSFELAPFERRDLLLNGGGELVKGAVRIKAESTVSVEGRIRTRLDPNGPIISQVTVLAEPLHSEVMIPISYGSDGIDNTGIALYFDTPGMLDFSLFDADGNLVREWEAPGWLRSPRQVACFVDEFPGVSPLLGVEFEGSLKIKFDAMGLAATALYTRGTDLWTAQVQTVREAENEFRVYLEDGVDGSVIYELSDQYGFRVSSQAGSLWGIMCTDEVAQAVERDSRVKKVTVVGPAPIY